MDHLSFTGLAGRSAQLSDHPVQRKVLAAAVAIAFDLVGDTDLAKMSGLDTNEVELLRLALERRDLIRGG
jgi:hypothetical protein